MREFISVSVLNGYIHNIFLAEDMLRTVRVAGEIADLRVVKDNAYFTLRDAKAQVSCTFFGCSAADLPQNGDGAVVTGSVDYYVKGGKLSFVARQIEKIGAGLLAVQLERLRRELEAEGLFDPARKKPIPRFCSRVCVLTSVSGAAVRDIMTTVRRKNSYVDLYVRDIRVQGERNGEKIVAALREVDDKGFDALVLARGGGSGEDLSVFNRENVVRAVAAARTPLISALGHETDWTLCDLASDLRVPTPTAAGEAVAFDQAALLRYFREFSAQLGAASGNALEKRAHLLADEKNKLKLSFRAYYSDWSAKLEQFAVGYRYKMREILQNGVMRLAAQTAALDAANPAGALRRGYFRLRRDGVALPSLQSVREGDEVELVGETQRATAKILTITDTEAER